MDTDIVNIDYIKLIGALNCYKRSGFKYVDVPWLVQPETTAMTKPDFSQDFLIKGKALVGSAEQSFLQMIIDKELPDGRYCTATPCFRDEQVDELHKTYFMKVELIDTQNVTLASLADITNHCNKFFQSFLSTRIVQLNTVSFDIVSSRKGIELGSYGIREVNGLKWIYATGCAEPRLTYAIENDKG